MKKNKILLINTQFVELYVSGFTNRFIGLWCYIQKDKSKYDSEVHWITNRSLWNKFFTGKQMPAGVTVLKAHLKWFKFTSRLFYPFYIVYIYYKEKCTSVHVATSIIDSLYLVRLFNLFNIPYCFTFASNSLEMGSYNNEKAKKRWQKLFSLAKNIEVLNPTNTIQGYRGNKFISPTSFPYLPQFKNLPEELLTNEQRSNDIVFCGSFVAQKNPLLAIHGFEWYLQHSRNRPADVKLKMIGKGDLLQKVRDEIDRVNSRFGDVFIEIIPENYLIETLASSKVFLSLQEYDNYPSQSVMEAMLFCNSVIATNTGDTSRLVDPSRHNVLISKPEPELLGEAIEQLLKDWKLNTANKNLIDEKFSPRVFASYFFELHHQISSEHRTPMVYKSAT